MILNILNILKPKTQPAMDKLLFQGQIEACRAKTEEVTGLEILNYSVRTRHHAPTALSELSLAAVVLITLVFIRTQRLVRRRSSPN